MNSSFRIAIAMTAGLLVSAASARAQTAAGEPGLIGKRYTGADYSYDHYSGAAIDHAQGVGGVVNLPVSPKADLGFAYTYSDAEGGPTYGAIGKGLSGSFLVHESTPYGRGYFAASRSATIARSGACAPAASIEGCFRPWLNRHNCPCRY